MSIAIFINGKKEEIANSLTIRGLLGAKKIIPDVVSVELNEEIIAKDKYGAMVLKSGDKLEFVYYMGGGMPFSDRIAKNVVELIGQTPVVRLNRIAG